MRTQDFLSICYPISYIEPLLNKIVDKIFSEGKNKKLSRKQDIKTLISGARMKIEPIMAETEMTTLEILNLKEGDVIVFNKNAASSDSIVYVNKKRNFLLFVVFQTIEKQLRLDQILIKRNKRLLKL